MPCPTVNFASRTTELAHEAAVLPHRARAGPARLPHLPMAAIRSSAEEIFVGISIVRVSNRIVRVCYSENRMFRLL